MKGMTRLIEWLGCSSINYLAICNSNILYFLDIPSQTFGCYLQDARIHHTSGLVKALFHMKSFLKYLHQTFDKLNKLKWFHLFQKLISNTNNKLIILLMILKNHFFPISFLMLLLIVRYINSLIIIVFQNMEKIEKIAIERRKSNYKELKNIDY